MYVKALVALEAVGLIVTRVATGDVVTAELANQVPIELEPGDNGAQALEGVRVEYSVVVAGVAGCALEPVGVAGQARVVAGFAVLLGC